MTKRILANIAALLWLCTQSASANNLDLLRAIEHGRLDEVTTLIAEGADVNQGNAYGYTALHMIDEDNPLYKTPIWWQLFDAQWN